MWARGGERRGSGRPVGDPGTTATDAPATTPSSEDSGHDAERIDRLIHDVRDLRTRLAVDLSFAAGAAEQGAVDVVAEIVAWTLCTHRMTP